MKNIILVFVCVLCFVFSSFSQEIREFDLTTPHGTVYNHLHYLQSDRYRPELSARSISTAVDEKSQKEAIRIKQILDAKGLFIVMSKIPGYETGDSIPENTYVIFPEELPDLYLEKRNDNWYYSKETLERLPQIHKSLYPMGSDFLLDIFPKFGTGKFLGLMMWQFIGFLLFLLTAFLSYMVLSKIIDLIISKVAKNRLGDDYSDNQIVHKIARIIGLLLVTHLFSLFLPVLQFPIAFSKPIYLILDILKYIFFIILTLRILDLIIFYAAKWAEKTESKMDDQLLIILKRFLQIGIVVFGFSIVWM